MYLPPHFTETRPDELRRMVEHNPLGALVTNGPNGLDANQIPFELDQAAGEHGVLRGHVARANPLWKELADGAEVLVIFRAMDAYISPNWYPSKQETHRHVPTWNYQVVNVHGKIRIVDDEKYVRGVVARLTRINEARTDADKPWQMRDAPREYIDAMLRSIVGIEIVVTRMIGKSKLSQNREDRDRVAAAEELGRRGQQSISDAMLDP